MLQRRKKKASDKITVGIDAQSDGLAVAVAKKGRENTRLRCEFVPFSGGGSQVAALNPIIQNHGLHGASAVLVMPESEYSLLQTSVPVMSLDEMRDAVRWKIGELVDFPLAQAVLDVFEVPESGQRGTERLLYVVATKRQYVQDHIGEIRRTDLSLTAIDIGELSLRNVIAKLHENDDGVVVLHLAERSGSLVFIKQSEVYLTRRLHVGFDDLLLGEESTYEDVVLELQRSLDFFESNFVQALPTKLLIFPPDKLTGELITHINSQLKLEVEPLILEKLPGYIVEADEQSQTRSLLAIGAALREEVAA